MLDIRRQHVDLAFKKRDFVCIKLLWIFTYARVFERRLRIRISQIYSAFTHARVRVNLAINRLKQSYHLHHSIIT